MSASPSSAPAQDQPRQALCRATCMSSLCFGNVSCLGTARSGSPGPVQLAEGTKLGATGCAKPGLSPAQLILAPNPFPLPWGPALQQEELQLSAQQCGQMKELLLPEPSGSSGAPVCCCLPAQAPCQTLAGSAHAAPALPPESTLLTTVHELLAHHVTS